ncbi:MAG: hypothetical protein R8M45_03605 [Ghiorsea sp.]
MNEKSLKTLSDLNPTGSLFVGYGAAERAKMPLSSNMTTLDKTTGKSPNTMISIYRGAPVTQKKIVAGDFVTTNKQLAQDYAGTGSVITKKVRISDILDDEDEPEGEEYIYRPK